MNIKKTDKNGFTLLELLIVVSIIAVLSVALVLVLNPVEALRKARDAQRISDLNTLKRTVGIYMATADTIFIGGASNSGCKATPTTAWAGTSNKIYYSLDSDIGVITDTTLDGSSENVSLQVSEPQQNNMSGWISIPFVLTLGGNPISNLPLDPVNTINDLANVSSSDLIYRYACSLDPLSFEINAQLESAAFTTGGDNKLISDGGNNDNLYEVGTNLKILGVGTDF